MTPVARAEARTRGVRLAAVFGAVVFAIDVLVFSLLRYFAVGVVVGLLAGIGCAWLAYTRSTRMVLSAIGATPVNPADQPRLASLVDGLSIASGIKRPRLHVIDTPAPNAVVVGHDSATASLVVTTGLLDQLNRVELEGVLAHAMSRFETGEAQVATIAATTVGLPILLAERWLRADGAKRMAGRVMSPLASAVAPLVGRLLEQDLDVQADLAGTAITRFPPGLASALDTLAPLDSSIPTSPSVIAPLFVLSPFSSTEDHPLPGVVRHLPPHRPAVERIELLREL